MGKNRSFSDYLRLLFQLLNEIFSLQNGHIKSLDIIIIINTEKFDWIEIKPEKETRKPICLNDWLIVVQ